MTDKKENNKHDERQNQPKLPFGKKPKGKHNINYYWIYAIIGAVLIAINIFSWGAGAVKIEPSQLFDNFLVNHEIEKIVIVSNEQKVEVYIKPNELKKDKFSEVRNTTFGGPNPGPHYYMPIASPESFMGELKDAQKDFSDENKIRTITDPRKNWGGELLSWLLPVAIMIAIWIFIMRRMSRGGAGSQIFNIGKSKANLYDHNTSVKVTFDDVAGLDEAKEEVNEIVDFLKNPKRYTQLGAKIPKGALLVGAPGTGKTLLARAVAGEAKVPFFSLSGSDFVEMFVGVGASRVRDLFKQAKEKAPCIIFIDEIDAIGRARGKSLTQGVNDERENTLNQLLTEMDGFGNNSGVILLAATNRADVLDRALMRAGRFDRQIYVDMPDLNERKEIFKVHLKPLKLDNSVDTDFLARQTPGFSGADIANICNEAALIAARRKKTKVDKQDFHDAVDRIIAGLEKKNKIISEEEKNVIAFHEAGHATISWLLEYASPLVKVTIVPRGKSLGAAWYLPEERQITTEQQMMDEMCATLGGRASEELVFGEISTGALNDLEKVTKQAYAMVSIYGLNKKLGNVSYYDSSGQQEYSFHKPYSERTAQTIDEEANKLIEISYTRAKKILQKHKPDLILLAKRLREKEVIFKEDLELIFGKRPYPSKEEQKNNVTKKPEKKEEKISDTTETDSENKPKNGTIANTKPNIELSQNEDTKKQNAQSNIDGKEKKRPAD